MALHYDPQVMGPVAAAASPFMHELHRPWMRSAPEAWHWGSGHQDDGYSAGWPSYSHVGSWHRGDDRWGEKMAQWSSDWSNEEWAMWKSEYAKAQAQVQTQSANTALRSTATPWGLQAHLPEEPGEVLVVNSMSSGAYTSLCADAAEADLVAFDAEWRPDWDHGSDNPISVLQLAFPTSRRVYVMQLNQIGNKLPQAVQLMLVNPGVTKVGFAVGNQDAAKLARSNIALTKGSMIDVQQWCASALQLADPPETLSLKRAANGILGFNLQKDKRCSCSDWASERLTAEQIRYAALDAWVALRLYYHVSG
eukprot:TRINITY_DN90994_c0_g1_i1.p1 TRINITY_DN90994_c0_g1~~TRINITY_DN90994_c0_g1_i1.p1  ORF type:complete len:308 (+),score=54.24 TRINITY_DN90994_c0_g1_i1:159-1082(+)